MSEQGWFQVDETVQLNFSTDSSIVRGLALQELEQKVLNLVRNSVFRIRKHESVYIESTRRLFVLQMRQTVCRVPGFGQRVSFFLVHVSLALGGMTHWQTSIHDLFNTQPSETKHWTS